jgi:hypothetical protein
LEPEESDDEDSDFGDEDDEDSDDEDSDFGDEDDEDSDPEDPDIEEDKELKEEDRPIARARRAWLKVMKR